MQSNIDVRLGKKLNGGEAVVVVVVVEEEEDTIQC